MRCFANTTKMLLANNMSFPPHLLAELGSSLSLDPVEIDLAGGGQIGLIRQRREDLVDDAAGR